MCSNVWSIDAFVVDRSVVRYGQRMSLLHNLAFELRDFGREYIRPAREVREHIRSAGSIRQGIADYRAYRALFCECGRPKAVDSESCSPECAETSFDLWAIR